MFVDYFAQDGSFQASAYPDTTTLHRKTNTQSLHKYFCLTEDYKTKMITNFHQSLFGIEKIVLKTNLVAQLALFLYP